MNTQCVSQSTNNQLHYDNYKEREKLTFKNDKIMCPEKQLYALFPIFHSHER